MPDYSKFTARQLQQIKIARINALLPSCGGNYHAAFTLANDADPDLVAAIQAANVQPDDGVMSQANRAAIPQPTQDKAGLYSGATDKEWSAIWKKCGNSCDPDKADVGWDVLVGSAMQNQRLSAADAKADVRTRFKALSTKRDAIVTARQLGVDLPATSTPANAQFQPAKPAASSMGGTSLTSGKGLNTGKTGLGAFNVGLGNDASAPATALANEDNNTPLVDTSKPFLMSGVVGEGGSYTILDAR